MRRREFIGMLGGALGLCAPVAGAQQPADKKRIAIVAPSRPVEELRTNPYFRTFLEELSRRGFVEGENLVVDRYSGKGEANTYGDLARTVVASAPDAVFTSGSPMVFQLKAATRTIPIVASVGDPVAAGLASSLARPGTNLTGVTVDAGYGFMENGWRCWLKFGPMQGQLDISPLRGIGRNQWVWP